ncbi:MAG TPA: hypothetical protein VMK16_09580 [Acidimicrobiales bacterium]|nr:hypothetical protein [Acidimicrobiales bacterium]
MVERLVTPAMRQLLVVASVLVLVVGVPLMLRPEQTADYFAWTIQPPLTAAFLGSAYWASFLLELEASRRSTWDQARIAVPAVFAFTVLTLVATLNNLEKFHFGDPGVFTAMVTWGWLLVYAIVPVVMAVVWIRQSREPGIDGPRVRPTPLWFRVVGGVAGVALIAYGAVMFARPSAVASSWPWALTTLTAQAVGAWLVGVGIASVHGMWEADWERIEALMASTFALGVLEVFSLVRFRDDVDWNRANGWIYLVALLALSALGAYGWFAATRPMSADQRAG